MQYTELTKRAMCLAYAAHHGQMDKSGVPYIFHPIHVAEQMHTEAGTITALLHDVVEDTAVTWKDLETAGFPGEVLEALKLLTRQDGVAYLDYVRALKKNPLARAVKLADLCHNSDMTRLGEPDGEGWDRLKKYRKALAILQDED